MKLTEIQDLIKFVARSGVSEVEIEQKDFKITIKSESVPKRRGKQEYQEPMMQMPMAMHPMQQMQMPMPSAVPAQAPAAAPAPAASEPTPAANEESKYLTVKSPMIGTFYRSPSPDKPPFFNVGDSIKTGDVVCIIEAMKLFNEIESEVSGRVVKVLVDDNTPVEYDQPLFLIDPS